MSRMPVHEQKKLRMQRKAPKVRFANGMAELLHHFKKKETQRVSMYLQNRI
ncbi:MAG: hypothetical protein RR964_09975 [Lachnospiraceae bacterium]